MRKQTCFTCGTVFEAAFYHNKCNVCQQTEAIKKAMDIQVKPAYQENYNYIPKARPIYNYVVDTKDWPEYTPPSAEELEKKKEIKRINTLLTIAVVLSLPVAWVILWMTTFGWFTFCSFIAASYIPFYLYNKHWHWQVKNAKYLFQI